MYDLIAIGEMLVDMTPIAVGETTAFVPHVGGAPLNVLAMASALGVKTAFIGKVGADQFGKAIRDTVVACGIDARYVSIDETKPTTLAFVHLDKSGERSFSFYREASADVALTPEDDAEMKAPYRAVCFGSVALTQSPIREAVYRRIKAAKEMGALVFYDPNYRPLLWVDKCEAVEQMQRAAHFADVVKVSEEEAALITGGRTDSESAQWFLSRGVRCVFVTKGADGVNVYTAEAHWHVPAYKGGETRDTTGAGDAFFGATIGALIREGLSLETAVVKRAVHYGVVAAGLCVTRHGALPSYPTQTEIEEAMTC
ncbi:carbohydrate kinase family protein [Fusibacter sp. JL298sf-3]